MPVTATRIAALLLSLASFGGAALAQTGSIPKQTGSIPNQWSGRSGLSGDPTMTAEAISSAAANFRSCLAGFWPEAARRGVSLAAFQAATNGLFPDLKIMDLLDAQPEFTKSIWDYLDTLVSDARIEKGTAMLAQYRPSFDAVERAYGVDRHVLAAIWGVETNYGTLAGDRPVLRSTATLACIGRRQSFFREEFLDALEIVARGDIRPDHFKGSWAGAFGPTQFMPSTFKRFAVDFDHDGRRDFVDSVPDMLASTANKLKKGGWLSGETWGYEVVIPSDFNFLLADRAQQMTLHQWERAGIRRVANQPFPRQSDRAYLMAPAGVQGPGFLMLQNFRALMSYNPAEAYALAIGHLADRLRGGGPFVQAWPRYERVLSRDERRELQEHLVRRGYDIDADGHLGGKTRAALRQFQASLGYVPDGFASSSILNELRNR